MSQKRYYHDDLIAKLASRCHCGAAFQTVSKPWYNYGTNVLVFHKASLCPSPEFTHTPSQLSVKLITPGKEIHRICAHLTDGHTSTKAETGFYLITSTMQQRLSLSHYLMYWLLDKIIRNRWVIRPDVFSQRREPQ